jgi:hypothetical protein
MRASDTIAAVILGLCVLGGAIGIVHARPGDPPTCAETVLTPEKKLAIEGLRDIVKWGLGISVTMVGLFGSILLRVKDSLNLTLAGNLLAASIAVCFGWAAYFALLWSQAVAQVLFLKCVDQIAAPWLQRSYEAFTDFFLTGLAVTAAMIAWMIFAPLLERTLGHSK